MRTLERVWAISLIVGLGLIGLQVLINIILGGYIASLEPAGLVLRLHTLTKPVDPLAGWVLLGFQWSTLASLLFSTVLSVVVFRKHWSVRPLVVLRGDDQQLVVVLRVAQVVVGLLVVSALLASLVLGGR